MKIIYMSLTGQVRKFVKKLSLDGIEIKKNTFFSMDEPYIVIVPTYAHEVTMVIDEFIDYESNLQFLKGVCGSGNRNFNDLFCFSAKDLSKKYDVPLIHCFEFNGSEFDVKLLEKEVQELGKS